MVMVIDDENKYRSVTALKALKPRSEAVQSPTYILFEVASTRLSVSTRLSYGDISALSTMYVYHCHVT